MKRITSALLTITLALSFGSPASADQWTPASGGPNQYGLSLTDASADYGVSNISYFEDRGPNQYLCEELGKAPCAKSAMTLFGVLILPKCEIDSQQNCVEGLQIKIGEQTYVGEFVEYVPGQTVTAQPKYGLPEGKTSGKWKVTGVANAGGTEEYAVSVGLRTETFSRNKVNFGSATIQVVPFKTITGDYRPVEVKQSEFSDGVKYVSSSYMSSECAWTASGQCGRKQDFAEGSVVTVSLRLTSAVGGWFNGRMKSPDIQISTHAAGSNRLVITGEPARVSRLGFSVPRDQATPALKKMFETSRDDVSGISVPANQDGSFDYVAASREQLKDTASGETTTWAIQTVKGSGNPCLSNTSRVLGIVTTNAMAYQADAPKFSRGRLEYQVSGLHLQPGGVEPVLGTYDLVMRSDVARCLYRFSKAPVQASISVTGEGDKNIATTLVGESKGWLKLAAYGFTFSKKTIKVSITQKKQSTLTCVSTTKPTKTQKVTGVSPKCPAGFKKR